MATSADRLSVAALVIASPFAAVWLIGDLSTVPVSSGRDYFIRPVVSSATVRDVGIGCLAVAMICGVRLVRSAPITTRNRRAVWSLGVAILTGLLLAGGYRTVTAGVIGANIGAGIFVLFGLPMCVALVAVSCALAFLARSSA